MKRSGSYGMVVGVVSIMKLREAMYIISYWSTFKTERTHIYCGTGDDPVPLTIYGGIILWIENIS